MNNRTVRLGACLLAAGLGAGCGDATGPEGTITGIYDLVEMDGKRMPATFFESGGGSVCEDAPSHRDGDEEFTYLSGSIAVLTDAEAILTVRLVERNWCDVDPWEETFVMDYIISKLGARAYRFTDTDPVEDESGTVTINGTQMVFEHELGQRLVLRKR